MTNEAFNLDAVVAEARAESPEPEKEPFKFIFGGEEFTLPARVNVLALGAITKGRVSDALSTLMGAEQFARLEQSDALFDLEAFKALLEAYMTYVGTPGSLGE